MPDGKEPCVYPFGLDPAWAISENSLQMSNAIKMKMSVIFGVLHMSFGVFIKGMNLIYSGKYLDMLTEVIPGFVILWGLFGWMDAQIIIKWFYNNNIDDTSNVVTVTPQGGGASYLTYAPEVVNSKLASIISIMINGALSPGFCTTPSKPDDINTISYLGDNVCTLYNINTTLLLCIFIAVPVMLCTKPCIVYCSEDKHAVHEAEVELQHNTGDQSFSPNRSGANPKIQRSSDGESREYTKLAQVAGEEDNSSKVSVGLIMDQRLN